MGPVLGTTLAFCERARSLPFQSPSGHTKVPSFSFFLHGDDLGARCTEAHSANQVIIVSTDLALPYARRNFSVNGECVRTLPGCI